jgi:protein-S-isoprenylcysteine O-methyltransferase Ste14
VIDDHPFRTILLAECAVLAPLSLYHRLRSQASGEGLDRRQEGLFVLLTLRPIGIAGLAGFAAYLIDPDWMAWARLALSAVVRWLGIGLGALGSALFVWTLRALGPNLTDTVVTRREHTLVTSGPYRYVRHPFYVATALVILGNAFAAANGFLLATGILVLALLVLRTRKEEANLLARFGDEYRRYGERTGRFLPRRPLPRA